MLNYRNRLKRCDELKAGCGLCQFGIAAFDLPLKVPHFKTTQLVGSLRVYSGYPENTPIRSPDARRRPLDAIEGTMACVRRAYGGEPGAVDGNKVRRFHGAGARTRAWVTLLGSAM